MPNKAIVVGIQAYPELPPQLQGPKNDAQMFFDWVTTHGGVNPADGTLILGDDPPAAMAVDGRPTAEALKDRFDRTVPASMPRRRDSGAQRAIVR